MKFIVDAQLPKRLSDFLRSRGHDSIHTLDLQLRNATPDPAVTRISINQKRVLVTKDSDFLDSYLVNKVPYKLLLITTGNITNNELLELIEDNLQRLISALKHNWVVELTKETFLIHQ